MSKQPDFKNMTDDQLCVLFRDSIKDIDFRKQIYPRFLKDFEKVPGRDAKLLVMREYLLKIKDVQKSGRPISTESTVDNNNTHTHLDNNNNNIVGFSGRPKNWIGVSVWEKIQEYISHPEKVEDPAFFNRLRIYTKRALFIIHVIDIYQVITPSESFRKAQEVKGINIRSKSTTGDILKDLYTDGLLDLEIIERQNTIDTKVYSVKGYQEIYPEKYQRATERHRQKNGCPKIWTSNSVDRVVNHNEEVKRRTVEKEQELMKGSVTKIQEHKEKKSKERKQKREEEKTIRHPDLNPVYAEKYVEGIAELKKIYIEEKRTKNEQIAQQNYGEAVETLRADLLKQQTAETQRAHAQANESEGKK